MSRVGRAVVYGIFSLNINGSVNLPERLFSNHPGAVRTQKQAAFAIERQSVYGWSRQRLNPLAKGSHMATRPPANLREHLRLVTRDAHLRLEAEVDFDGRLTSLEVYRSFLEGFFRFVSPVEAVLGSLDLKKFGIDYRSRRKLSWIEADLRDLGHTGESLEKLPKFEGVPRLAEPVEALGALYVLEGSSLGRQVMLGKLAARLNISPDWAGHFFSGYGKETGVMWRNFVTALNEAGQAPEAARLIEAAALASFAAFEQCLAETRLRGGVQACCP